MTFRTLLAAAVLALGSAPVRTQDALPDMAALEAARDRGDFVTVRDGLERLVEAEPTPLARYRLALLLIEGRGGPRDLAQAVAQLDAAAQAEHFPSAVLLARSLLTGGPDTPREPARAVRALRGPAEAGYADALYYLGLLQATGEGVSRDPEEAAASFRAAAEDGHPEAQFELARAYREGLGVAPDGEAALRWLRRAAEGGHVPAQVSLGLTLDGMKRTGEALDWYRRAAESGAVLAQRLLGMRYLQGDGVAPDADEGLRWLQAAAAAGDAGAMSNLGWAFATGTGVAQDYAQARDWYGRATRAGLGRAAVALGRLTEEGLGGPADARAAVALYRGALEGDSGALAAQALGGMALNGTLGVDVAPQRAVPWVAAVLDQRPEKAEAWLRDRAAQDDPAAAEALALWLLSEPAEDGAQDGVALLKAAAQAGRVDAQMRLAELSATGAQGLPLDYEAAHAWYNIAATLGATEAAGRRDALNALMTPEQIAAAQARARAWFAAEKAPGAIDRP
ncbi:tetratricopeptide repeat protein [Citreimonas sp.]|uniref:tetratricopeptide repeat protein n=1 Tax=Citreimonas sp. TaxID=3036715 RepID=UPI0035C7A570